MNGAILGIYATILFGIVGAGNSATLMDYVKRDMGSYFPWLISILVISILTQFESTKKLVMPFVGLLVLNYFLKNWDTIETQFRAFYNSVKSES